VTILLVSHDLSVVSRQAHHILCLRDGKIQCEGPPAKVLTPEVLGQTFGPEMGLYTHHHHGHGHAHEHGKTNGPAMG
jgi:ABC-type cobalamin/Fe3+-siderophores transport system ATPase subunit